jgi:hypothetical protein
MKGISVGERHRRLDGSASGQNLLERGLVYFKLGKGNEESGVAGSRRQG